MPPPHRDEQPRPSVSPSSLIRRAQENKARHGFTPAVLAARQQEAQDNPEAMKRRARDQAEKMGLTIDAVIKKHAPEATKIPLSLPPNQVDRMKPHRMEIRTADNKSNRSKITNATTDRNPMSFKPNLGSSLLGTPKTSRQSLPEMNTRKAIKSENDDLESQLRRWREFGHYFGSEPQWYIDINDSNFEMKKLAKRPPQAVAVLRRLKDCISRCEMNRKPIPHGLHEEAWDLIHQAEIKLDVNRFIIKLAKILSGKNGLPRIFMEGAEFPPELKDDAYQLYARWASENFSNDVLRNIITVKDKNRGYDQIHKGFKIPADYRGAGQLVLGQCWPSQLSTVRDGAHGSTQGGIYGRPERGAFSIVLSGSDYKHDEDHGELIKYSGTESKNGAEEPTAATQYMILSYENQEVIRVLRSSKLHKENFYRPEEGYRYDGLYKVVSYQMINKDTQLYLFTLKRCPGQQPVRCGKGKSARPTVVEIEEFRRLKRDGHCSEW